MQFIILCNFVFFDAINFLSTAALQIRLNMKKIVAVFRGMHVSPAKHSSWSLTDGQKDRQTDGQTTDKVIPICRYVSQATQKLPVVGNFIALLGYILYLLLYNVHLYYNLNTLVYKGDMFEKVKVVQILMAWQYQNKSDRKNTKTYFFSHNNKNKKKPHIISPKIYVTCNWPHFAPLSFWTLSSSLRSQVYLLCGTWDHTCIDCLVQCRYLFCQRQRWKSELFSVSIS